MIDNTGFISLHRTLQSHWIWRDPNKLKWWLDILLTVNFKPAKVNLGNELYDCKRGQALMSILSWADRWKVSKDTARNFLKLLEKENMIECVSIGKSTRLTVCNYDTYQTSLHVKKQTAVRAPSDNSLQYNNDNNDNKKSIDVSELDKAFKLFLDMRVKTKKPATDRAIELLIAKLEKLAPGNEQLKIQIVEQSTLNNWQDVFPLKQLAVTNNQQTGNPDNVKYAPAPKKQTN